MNIFAVYHAGRLSLFENPDGLTTIRKGRHVMSAVHVRSEGELMASVLGWMRNRAQLVRELGLSDDVSDAQIVMSAYRRWGVDYPEHIEGPAATVLIDRSNERMLVTRDRMGERRLFYCRHGRTAAISDHPDALLNSPYTSRVVDVSGLNELFALGPARTPGRTPYRDIMSLEPGCVLIAERSGVKIHRYYSMKAYTNEDDFETAAEKVREMLERAVGDVMPMADAAMLSGGIDSTALAALMQSLGRSPRTYSVDYENDEADFTGNEFQPERDRDYIAIAKDILSAEHTDIKLGHEELCKGLGAAMDARGLPGMADIDSSLMLFARRISGSASDIVSGECGDEVFCGYPWFHKGGASLAGGFPWSGSMELRRSVLRREAAELMKPERYAEAVFRNAVDTAPRVIGESPEETDLRIMQYLCFRFFMSNLQERALCMCEAGSVNVYTPFCDDRLAEYVWNTPGSIKSYGGEVKALLRESVKDLLPEKLLRRRKSPYPKVYSPLYTGAVKKAVLNILEDRDSPVLRVVDRKVLAELNSSEQPAAGLPWFGQLMSGPQMLAYIWQVNEWMKTRRVELTI